VKVFRPKRTNLELWNSYFRAAKRQLCSTSVSFLKLLFVLSGPPSLSQEVPPIMVDFNLGTGVGKVSSISIIHCRIIVHHIIFFQLGIHEINLCVSHQCNWAGSLSRQGCLGILWLEIYLGVPRDHLLFFSWVEGDE
jgi:hypothetical protein